MTSFLKRVFASPDETVARIPVRGVYTAMLAFLLSAVVIHFLPDSHVLLAVAKVIGGTLTVGVIPGVTSVLLVRPLEKHSLLPVLAVGAIISLGLSQIAAFVSLLAHIALTYVAWGILIITAAGILALIFRGHSDDGGG